MVPPPASFPNLKLLVLAKLENPLLYSFSNWVSLNFPHPPPQAA